MQLPLFARLYPPLDQLRITQGYGGDHRAVDYAAAKGTPAKAAFSGKVVDVTSSGNCGTGLAIQKGSWRVRYCHFDSLSVQAGDQVRAGQVVGTTGTTGNVTGPHLHFALGIRCDGEGGNCLLVSPSAELKLQAVLGWVLTAGLVAALAGGSYVALKAALK